jgi:hypothetical protein
VIKTWWRCARFVIPITVLVVALIFGVVFGEIWMLGHHPKMFYWGCGICASIYLLIIAPYQCGKSKERIEAMIQDK